MDSSSADKMSISESSIKPSEGGLTPRRIFNGTAFKSTTKHAHPFHEAAMLKGGFGISAVPASPQQSSPRLSAQLHSNNSHDGIRRQSKSLSYFPNLPALIDPKVALKLQSSMSRLAQSDSNVSISSLNKRSHIIPRRPTTIHVARKESMKLPTSSNLFKSSVQPDRAKTSPVPKSWKNEAILANFTTMNPNSTNLESLSIDELEKKIAEKASQLTFNQSSYVDVNRQLSRYIGKPAFGIGGVRNSRTASPSSIRNDAEYSQGPLKSHATSKNSTAFVTRSSSALKLRSPGLGFTPGLAEFVQTDIARRMLRMLEGIGIGQDRPATPNTAKNETLKRLKKAYDILQEELSMMNIDEAAFLRAKGVESNHVEHHFKMTNEQSPFHKQFTNLIGNAKRLRSTTRTGKWNDPPMQEICETFKGPRVPKLSSSLSSRSNSKTSVKADLKPSTNRLTRPATTSSLPLSAIDNSNNIPDETSTRRQKYNRWADQYRANLESSLPKTVHPMRPASATSATKTAKTLNARNPVKNRLEFVK